LAVKTFMLLAVKTFIVSPLPRPNHQARDLARRLATGTDSLSRKRGTASPITTATAMARP